MLGREAAYLVNIEVVKNPHLEKSVCLAILLGAKGRRLVDGFAVGTKVLRFSSKDLFGSVESSLKQIVCNLGDHVSK